jgi:hypothetical protein
LPAGSFDIFLDASLSRNPFTEWDIVPLFESELISEPLGEGIINLSREKNGYPGYSA